MPIRGIIAKMSHDGYGRHGSAGGIADRDRGREQPPGAEDRAANGLKRERAGPRHSQSVSPSLQGITSANRSSSACLIPRRIAVMLRATCTSCGDRASGATVRAIRRFIGAR
jgi:hypothetical protein